VLFTTAVVAGCGVALPRPPTSPENPIVQPPQPEDLVTGSVIWVDDGDTIEVDIDGGTISVRLIGINAPERDECFADEPREYLIKSIENRVVAIAGYGSDQFGRTLGDVWFDHGLVNLHLVALGLAIAVTPGDGYQNGEALLEAESAAYEARIGLWGAEVCGSSGPIPAIDFDLTASQTDPEGPDNDVLDDEHITLVNNGDRPVDMSGWVLRDESSSNRLEFPAGTILRAGDRMQISSGCSPTPSWCGSTPIWNNGGDMALLLDTRGRVVARARY
jgi:endonuclease YncB( thermonuclease family)